MAELVTSQGYQLVPDVAGSLAGGYQAGTQLRGAYDENQRQSQFRQLAGVIQDPRATPEQKMQAQQQLSAIDPERTQKLQQSITQNLSTEELRQVTSIARGAAQINAIPTPEGRLQAAKNRRQQLIMEGRDTTETDGLINALESGEYDLAQQMLGQGIQAGQLIGVLEPTAATGAGVGTGKIGTYNPRDYTVESFSQFTASGDPSVLERYTEKTIDVGGVPHQLNPNTNQYEPVRTAQQVGSNKAIVSTLVKEAESKAKQRGETLTELNQARAALPGLKSTVSQLKELAPLATSTVGEKIFDTAVKQTGFGSTKGATARAKFVAIVNNQVLPLLKQTFGAAFTVAEGAELKATMGDPDASPEEKLAQLDAFIDSKVQEIETKEGLMRQTGAPTAPAQTPAAQQVPAGQPQVIRFDAQGNIIQ